MNKVACEQNIEDVEKLLLLLTYSHKVVKQISMKEIIVINIEHI